MELYLLLVLYIIKNHSSIEHNFIWLNDLNIKDVNFNY